MFLFSNKQSRRLPPAQYGIKHKLTQRIKNARTMAGKLGRTGSVV